MMPFDLMQYTQPFDPEAAKQLLEEQGIAFDPALFEQSPAFEPPQAFDPSYALDPSANEQITYLGESQDVAAELQSIGESIGNEIPADEIAPALFDAVESSNVVAFPSGDPLALPELPGVPQLAPAPAPAPAAKPFPWKWIGLGAAAAGLLVLYFATRRKRTKRKAKR
jgi:hypothetical protein